MYCAVMRTLRNLFVKRCYKCKQIKPVSEFNKNKNKPDGYGSACRNCMTDYMASIEGKTTRLFSSCKRRAKLTQSSVTITKDWIKEKLNAGVCEVTGLPFNFNGRNKHTRQAYAPSIDRINSENPNYTPENCRLVLWAVNCSMSEYGEEIMLPIFRAILNAKEKSITPIPTRVSSQSSRDTQSSALPTTWAGEDSNNVNDYRGATQGENSYRSAKEGSGDGMGYRDAEVGAPQAHKDSQDTGHAKSTVGSVEEFFERVRSQSRELDLAAGTARKVRQFGD